MGDATTGPSIQTALLPGRHALDFITELSPVISLEFRIFDPLLAPVLVEATDVILALLEMAELISDTLLDENAACMLLYNGLFVLQGDENW